MLAVIGCARHHALQINREAGSCLPIPINKNRSQSNVTGEMQTRYHTSVRNFSRILYDDT